MALAIHSAQTFELVHRFLVQELPYVSFPIHPEDTVVPAHLRRLLDGQGCRTLPIEINLQRIEQQQHIPGTDQHSPADPGSHAAAGNHKFIKQGRSPAIWKEARHRGKQLATGRILGNALTVPTGMDHQDPFPRKGAFPLMDIPQHMQGSSTASHPLTIRVRKNGIMGTRWQHALP